MARTFGEMGLLEAIMVGQESIQKEIEALEARAKVSRRVNVDRLRRLKELRAAYRLLDAEFERLDAVEEGPDRATSSPRPDGRA